MTCPPITEFKDLKIVTMTVIARLHSCRLNLKSIFMLLPVTNRYFPINEKRSTKVKYPPGFNIQGEITSVTFQNTLRGIRRSKNVSSFPNGIIIDIGTSEKIVNLKLSPSIEVTGVRSPELAKEAFEDIISKLIFMQKAVTALQNNRGLTSEVIERLRVWKTKNGFTETPEFSTQTDFGIIYKFIAQLTNLCKDENDYQIMCNNILSLPQGLELYNVEPKIKSIEYPMTNTCFDIGFHINRSKFATLINNSPFECNFSNAADSSSDSAVQVTYPFDQTNAITGKVKRAKHTIRVNKSGYTTHSSPDRTMSEAVYYTFRQKVNEIWFNAVVAEGTEQIIKTSGISKSFTEEEYKSMVEKQNDLCKRIYNNEVPTIISTKETKPKLVISEIKKIGPSIPEMNTTFNKLYVF